MLEKITYLYHLVHLGLIDFCLKIFSNTGWLFLPEELLLGVGILAALVTLMLLLFESRELRQHQKRWK